MVGKAHTRQGGKYNERECNLRIADCSLIALVWFCSGPQVASTTQLVNSKIGGALVQSPSSTAVPNA